LLITDSLHEERSDDILDLFISELEVISVESEVRDLASLVQRLQPYQVVLVEVSLVHRKHTAVSLQLPEPRRFLRVYHCVLVEHHEQCSVQAREVVLQCSVGAVFFLAVQVGQEHRELEVVGDVSGVSEVPGGAYPVLDEGEVNELVSDEVDDVADEPLLAAPGDGGYSHVRASEGN